MDANPSRPHHQKETEWDGDLQQFSGSALAPNDPCLEPRCAKRPTSENPT